MTEIHAAERAERRAQARALLADYPGIDDFKQAELLHWLRAEATPLEIATISGDPSLAEPYARFKADHPDGVGVLECLRFILLFAGSGSLVALLVWMVQ